MCSYAPVVLDKALAAHLVLNAHLHPHTASHRNHVKRRRLKGFQSLQTVHTERPNKISFVEGLTRDEYMITIVFRRNSQVSDTAKYEKRKGLSDNVSVVSC